jgi:hypothetical protein
MFDPHQFKGKIHGKQTENNHEIFTPESLGGLKLCHRISDYGLHGCRDKDRCTHAVPCCKLAAVCPNKDLKLMQKLPCQVVLIIISRRFRQA